MTFRVLVLGGYGNFGARIARALASLSLMHVTVAGRDGARAAAFAADLAAQVGRPVDAAMLDVDAPDLREALARLAPDLVIHTSGPFQGRDYAVPRAALDAGAHYVDLADARAYVLGIRELDDAARARERLVVSGASSVPGLAAAVIDAFAHEFDALDSIDVAISPGNRAPRGPATVAAILSCVGRAFPVWRDGRWQAAWGWQGLRRVRFGSRTGTRWIADCDIPDLELFPDRYPGVRDVRFGAGLELSVLHLGLWLLSWGVRLRLLPSLAPRATLLLRAANLLSRLGSDTGGMRVVLDGMRRNRRLVVHWRLTAGAGDGPQVPCAAAIVLARKLADGALAARGAMPCAGLFSLEECVGVLEGFDITTGVQRTLAGDTGKTLRQKTRSSTRRR